MLVLELFTILGFGAIAFQDLKERMVSWVLFPMVAILLATMHLYHHMWDYFIFFSLTNILIVTGVLTILFLYIRLIRGKRFLNTSFGLGDILFMYAFALGFPTVTFLVLFAGSIFFSLLGFVIITYFSRTNTVPLAGLMGLFLAAIMVLRLFTNQFSLYLI
ncbi:MAG: hypothetical protein AAGC45_15030 [Bacteroidota bacterium]